MQGIDLAIVVTAVVAVIGSGVGLALYEPDTLPEFELLFETHDLGATTVFEEQLSGSAARQSNWEQDVTNVTRILFTLTVEASGPRAEPTIVEFTITPANGSAQTKRVTLEAPNDATSEEEVTFDLASVPGTMTVRAESNRTAVAEGPVNTTATGDWTIEARIASGGGGVLGQLGETVTATAEAKITRYDAHAVLSVPEVAGSA